jgi:hypothetical protein
VGDDLNGEGLSVVDSDICCLFGSAVPGDTDLAQMASNLT